MGERSGIHLTGTDSGWPVADDQVEPGHVRDGSGEDDFPLARQLADGVVKDGGGATLEDATARNEVQLVTIDASAGTFTLTFAGQTTAPIASEATAAQVKAALVALSNVGTKDVSVSGSAGGPYTVTFKGKYADSNVAQMTTDATALSGTGAHTAVVTTPTGGLT